MWNDRTFGQEIESTVALNEDSQNAIDAHRTPERAA